MAYKSTDVVSFTFEQFYEHVDRYISRRLGIGLESLADVDIWDFYTSEPSPISFWRVQVQDAAQCVIEAQDTVDPEILALFE